MKIALTGHRPERLKGHETEISNWINEQLKTQEYTEAYSGMAQGADQIFADSALNNNISLICCFPYRRKFFHEKEIEIMDKAKDIRFISEEYSKQSFWIRDKYMVDNCDVLLAIWDGIEKGGTWITVQYARRVGKPIIYFPQDILTQ